MSDLSEISNLVGLRRLELFGLKQVTELPELSRVRQLVTVRLETMRGISDLAPLLTAPVLEEVLLVDMSRLKPEDLGILASHPTLQRVLAGLGSQEKNEAAARLVNRPADDYVWPRWKPTVSSRP